jgi:outer membrane receptor protein involved in Fe transport
MKRPLWTGLACAVSLAGALLWQPAAHAQTGTSVLQGVVANSAKKPIEGAIVTVSSPALQVEQIAATDSSGFYRIPNLPAGKYLLRVENEGFLPHERAEIALRGDVTFQLNVELITEASQQERVVIIERPPAIDLGSSSTTTTISEEMVRRVPIARPGAKGAGVRSFESMAEAAPAAKGDLYGTSIAGTSSPENRYLIDGLSVNNTAYGIGGTHLTTEFIKEVNVVTGGYLPEYGRSTGGILSVTTKSGSNQIKGSAWSYFTPGVLEGSPKLARQTGQTVVTERPQIDFITDFGADIGFPIIRDKLWLYGGVQLSSTRYDLKRHFESVNVDANGMPLPNDPATGAPPRSVIPGTEQKYDADGNALQAIVKLSYAPNADHNLSFTSIVAPFRSGGGGGYGIDPELGVPEIDPSRQIYLNGQQQALANVFNTNSFDNTVKWTAATSGKRILVDTTVGWHHESNDILPADGSDVGSGTGLAGTASVVFRRTKPHPITDFEENIPAGFCDAPGTAEAIRCPVTSYSTNSSTDLPRHSLLDRYQARSVLSVLAQALGHHVFKIGADVELTTYDLKKAYVGKEIFRENTAGTTFSDYRKFGYLVGPDEAVTLTARSTDTKTWQIGGFLQDSWSILDKVTVNLGVRYDSQYVYDSAGQLGVALPYQFAPRTGVIWDPSQTGRAKVFASYARYYSSVALDMADRALSGDPTITSVRPRASCDPRDLNMQQTACQADGSKVTLGDTFTPNQQWTVTGGGFTPIDPNLEPSSQDEIVIGGEYQILGESRIGLSYTKRWLGNIIEDMSRDEATTYFLGNPGRGIAASFPKAKRNFDAVTAYFTRSFHDNWLAQASYTLSWLRGNYNGLFKPENGQLDPNILSDFDLESLLPNADGWLPGDRRHQVKLFGAYDYPIAKNMHLQAGIGARASSGAPSDYLGSHFIYGSDVAFVLERGSGQRLPWQYSGDVQVGYGIDLGSNYDLTLTIDAYNIFNFQAGVGRDSTYTRGEVLPIPGGKSANDLGRLTTSEGGMFDPKDVNPNFGKITAYQAPRLVRFGLRLNY